MECEHNWKYQGEHARFMCNKCSCIIAQTTYHLMMARELKEKEVIIEKIELVPLVNHPPPDRMARMVSFVNKVINKLCDG